MLRILALGLLAVMDPSPHNTLKGRIACPGLDHLKEEVENAPIDPSLRGVRRDLDRAIERGRRDCAEIGVVEAISFQIEDENNRWYKGIPREKKKEIVAMGRKSLGVLNNDAADAYRRAVEMETAYKRLQRPQG